MKKLSLRTRLTLLSALLLTVCCVILDLCIMNSAIMKIDKLEDEKYSIIIESEENEYTINMPSLSPEFMEALNETKDSFRVQCVIITVIVILVGTALTWFVSGFALRPLQNLNKTMQEISASNLSEEVPEGDGKDEIAALTHSFNTMLRKINDSFTAQKQFTANAAHELRTPLAVLQTNLEVFEKKEDHTKEEYHQMIDTTLKQTGHMNHLISSLLELMSLHTTKLTDDIDPAALVEEILVDLSLPAENKKVSLTQSGDSPKNLKGNEVLFYRAIYNLVENAIKYNHENGNVNVDIKESESAIRLTISDTGKGIPKEHWDKIFRPFYRVDKARSREMGGVGLGLALVENIIELHNGTVFIEDSSENGTRICIEINK